MNIPIFNGLLKREKSSTQEGNWILTKLQGGERSETEARGTQGESPVSMNVHPLVLDRPVVRLC